MYCYTQLIKSSHLMSKITIKTFSYPNFLFKISIFKIDHLRVNLRIFREFSEIRTLCSFLFHFYLKKESGYTVEDTADDTTFHLKTLRVSEEGGSFHRRPPPGVSANFSLTRREGGSRCAREK